MTLYKYFWALSTLLLVSCDADDGNTDATGSSGSTSTSDSAATSNSTTFGRSGTTVMIDSNLNGTAESVYEARSIANQAGWLAYQVESGISIVNYHGSSAYRHANSFQVGLQERDCSLDGSLAANISEPYDSSDKTIIIQASAKQCTRTGSGAPGDSAEIDITVSGVIEYQLNSVPNGGFDYSIVAVADISSDDLNGSIEILKGSQHLEFYEDYFHERSEWYAYNFEIEGKRYQLVGEYHFYDTLSGKGVSSKYEEQKYVGDRKLYGEGGLLLHWYENSDDGLGVIHEFKGEIVFYY